MDKITEFAPDKTCNQLYDKLVPFFQSIDLEASTSDLTKNFIEFLQLNGLNVIGRICTVQIEDMENVKDDLKQSLENWQRQWTQDFMEPLTIVHDNKVSFHFPPVCLHKSN